MEAADGIALAVLAVFSAYDIKTKSVPVSAVAIVAFVTLIYRLCTGSGPVELLTGLLPGAAFLVLACVTGESIGIGDGLVLCVLGLFCGWRCCLAVIGMALMLSAVLAMILLVCQVAGRKTELPFLPCLFGGYLIYVLW